MGLWKTLYTKAEYSKEMVARFIHNTLMIIWNSEDLIFYEIGISIQLVYIVDSTICWNDIQTLLRYPSIASTLFHYRTQTEANKQSAAKSAQDWIATKVIWNWLYHMVHMIWSNNSPQIGWLTLKINFENKPRQIS